MTCILMRCGFLLKVHSHVFHPFAFFFHLCHPILENVNVKCQHNHLLPWDLFLTSDANANADVTCDQGLTDI